ncbi:MAG TPA: P-loop NTPase [Spirochaetota bacterium]|nr:P-loop NTPase [Spirochaetota bacterium]
MIEFDKSVFINKKDFMSDFFLKKTNKFIIPVASGKGGVGKTLFNVNLGIHLAQLGKNPVIIDLDLGGSNLHTYFGLKNNNEGIAGFLTNSRKPLASYKCATKIKGLELIPGDQLVPDMANVKRSQKKKIMEAIYNLPNDYILLDLGSGSNPFIVDFFLLTGKGILMTHPTHGAVLNAFNFLKTVVYRMFRLNFSEAKLRRLVNKIKRKDAAGQYPTFWDVLNDLARVNKKAALKFKDLIDSFKPMLVFNMVETVSDVKMIRQLITLIYKKLILDVDLLGYIPRLQEVHNSIKTRKPLAIYNKNCKASRNIQEIAQKIINIKDLNEPLFDIEKYDSSADKIEQKMKQDYDLKERPRYKKPLRKPTYRKLPGQASGTSYGQPDLQKSKEFIKDPFSYLKKRVNDMARQQSNNLMQRTK